MKNIFITAFACMFWTMAAYANEVNITHVQRIDFPTMPSIGTSLAGDHIRLGGFSGLAYSGQKTKDGFDILWTHTDRGPNAEPFEFEGQSQKCRPFPLPSFQPKWVKFALDRDDQKIHIIDIQPLMGPDAKPISGIPNDPLFDEKPCNVLVKELNYDPYGLDLEGIAFAPDGSVWMGDEYRPSLVHFSQDGKILDRYIPKGSNSTSSDMGSPLLSNVFARRKKNRGFEAIAVASNNKVYSFLQSPLPQAKSNKRVIRIVEFDTKLQKETGQYVYLLDSKKADKMGGMTHLKDLTFLVIERDGKRGGDAMKKVYQIDLANATNLHNLSKRKRDKVEKMSLAKLGKKGIVTAQKTLLADLVALGIDDVEKFEGIAVLDPKTIVLINDNDFGLHGDFQPSTGKLAHNNAPEKTSLVVLTTSKILY